jgi:hypothetical protein
MQMNLPGNYYKGKVDKYSGRCISLPRKNLSPRCRQFSLMVLLAIISLQLTGQTDDHAETNPESAGLLNNQLIVLRNNPEVYANPLSPENEPSTLFSFTDTTIVPLTARSQKSGVYWQFSVGVLTGKSAEDRSEGMISFRALTSYQFTRWFSAGIGIGADMLEYTVLPVFADFKLMLPVERSYYPYLYAKSGYSFPLKKSKETKFSTTDYFGGPMFGTGAGILLPGREDFRWYIEGGLRYSEISMDLRHAGLFKRTHIYYYFRPELRLGVFFN